MDTIKYGVDWNSHRFHCTNCDCDFEAEPDEYKITGPIEIEGKALGYSLRAANTMCTKAFTRSKKKEGGTK